jgi:transcriptional regulator with XRE-family HTH domain
MTAGRLHRTGQLPEAGVTIVAVNIRALRQRNGWAQAELGELMGWPNASTVCAAEGRRSGRQRGITAREVRQLATIFGVTSGRLTAQCANCNSQPSEGFACLACGAADHGGRGDRC